MKKKCLIVMATAIMATITMNVQAQDGPVWSGAGDRSTTTNYWSRQGDNVGGVSSNRLGTTDGYPIRFCTKDVDRVFIDTAGRVGINTSMPLQRLHVLDGNILISRSATDELGSTNGTIYFGDVVTPNQPFGRWGIEYVSSEKEGYGLNFWKPYGPGQQAQGNHFLFLADTGNVGIGTNEPTATLTVNGGILAHSIRISISTGRGDWPDYVFGEDYELMDIRELESYVNAHKHLPGVPSAEEVEGQGDIDLGKMNTILLEKVEELTRYVIDLQKQIDEMKQLDLGKE